MRAGSREVYAILFVIAAWRRIAVRWPVLLRCRRTVIPAAVVNKRRRWSAGFLALRKRIVGAQAGDAFTAGALLAGVLTAIELAAT